MTRAHLFVPVIAAAIMGLSACGGSDVAQSGKVIATGEAQIGGDFALVDQTGAPVTYANYQDKPQLIYFGFSYCPDVCPTSLMKMGRVQERVDPEGEKLNYLFVTVDPERDTPEAMAAYVEAEPFAKGLQGLTGTPEQIDAAKSAYMVYAQKVEDPGSAAEYTYDHTDLIYFMGEDGKLIDFFSTADSPDAIAAQVDKSLRG